MPFSILLLCFLAAAPSLNAAPPPARGFSINCGATKEETINGIKWIPDNTFVNTGNVSEVKVPGILPILSSLRYFPDTAARRYCFEFRHLAKRKKYLIRTTYFYGAFDGGTTPPVFDQIVDGTKWSTVDTTDNYAKGLSSYYEMIIQTTKRSNSITVCLARNDKTVSSPFISALELIDLEDSMYNATDFLRNGLTTVARHRFGHTEFMSYPDDPYNRYWMPFSDPTRLVVDSSFNITSTDLWNIPPANALSKGITASKGNQLVINWPAMNLPAASYYVALYFQDNRNPSPYSWRVFDVKLNNQSFYEKLNASTKGVMVYGARWPLSGQTEVRLVPGANMDKGPVINAGEVFQVVPLGSRTFPRDGIAMLRLSRGFEKPPSDWKGDPCLPQEYSWTGVTCAFREKYHRITSLNLTNLGLIGNVSQCIAKLTDLQSIDLSNNKLSGPLPDIRGLVNLVSLHLENNGFQGPIPPSLADLPMLKELNLQNNKFEGQVPDSLKNKPGLDVRLGMWSGDGAAKEGGALTTLLVFLSANAILK